jgi:hypothetical protein
MRTNVRTLATLSAAASTYYYYGTARAGPE